MSNLDKRLREKLKALVFDEWDYEDFVKHGLDSYVKAIKQDLQDDGWVQIPQATVRDATRDEVNEAYGKGMIGRIHGTQIYSINGDSNVMTGQEWYERFVSEYEANDAPMIKDATVIREQVFPIAKKASGL